MEKSPSQNSLSRTPVLNASQFDLQQQIGTGSFGTVFKALHRPTNTSCAVKRIDLENSEDEIEEIQREISILAECNDDHITRYFGCFVHEFELWIVMEFLGGGSCLDLLKDLRPSALPEAAIAEIIAEVVSGLAYLHQSGKIHRDIKAANVLISEEGRVKIADFGVAAQLSNNLSRRNTFVGTPFWMAPEVIDQRDYSFSADVWSLGITAIELAQGKPPLAKLHPMKALFAIPRNEPPKLDNKFSAEFQDFVARCLQRSARDRASISQLRRHPFLARRNRQELLYLMHQRMPPLTATHELTATMSSVATRDKAGRASSSASQRTVVSDADVSTLHFNSESQDQGVEENVDDDDDEGWDFDTIKPQPSLDQLLRNPPPPVEIPPAIPAPLPRQQPSGYATVDSLRGTVSGNKSGSQGVARTFGRAARKFREPVLEEIAEMLRADPLTVDVESYLVKRIGKLAMDNYDLKPRSKTPGLDAVEQILLDKWLGEVTELHGVAPGGSDAQLRSSQGSASSSQSTSQSNSKNSSKNSSQSSSQSSSRATSRATSRNTSRNSMKGSARRASPTRA